MKKKTGPCGSVFSLDDLLVWLRFVGLSWCVLAARDGFFASDGPDDRWRVPGIDMDLRLGLCGAGAGDGLRVLLSRWCAGRGAGGGFEALTHAASGFELDGSLCGDGDAFESLWVLGHARGAVLDFKDSEIAELEAVAFGDFVDHLIKKLLDDLLGDDTLVSGSLCDLIDESFLGDRFHALCLSVR